MGVCEGGHGSLKLLSLVFRGLVIAVIAVIAVFFTMPSVLYVWVSQFERVYYYFLFKILMTAMTAMTRPMNSAPPLVIA